MNTDLDPLEMWQQEIDELKFTVDLPLLTEPAAMRTVSARINSYMDHFARYRQLVESISGLAEPKDGEQLRKAIAAMAHEMQMTASNKIDLRIRLDTLSSLVRLEVEREHQFVEMLASRLDAPQIDALSSELRASTDDHQGSSSDGDESWAASPTQVDPNVDRSVQAVIERGAKNE